MSKSASATPKRRRRRRPALPPRRSYSSFEAFRAAFLAGGGMSASEIARVLGGTTAPRVCALLRRHGLTLVPKLPHQRGFVGVAHSAVVASLEQAADHNEIDTIILCGWAVEEMMRSGRLEELIAAVVAPRTA